MELAEYMRRNHPSCYRMTKFKATPYREQKTTVPSHVISRGKAIVLIGFVLTAVLPSQYALAVGFFTNAYWLIKL